MNGVVDETAPEPHAYDLLSPRQRAFLGAFPMHGSITAAAAAVGIHRDTVHGWLQRADETPGLRLFADAFLQAKEAAADTLETALFRKATEGKQAWDVTAAIFLLKGLRPDTYRENVSVRHSGALLHGHVSVLDGMSPADAAAVLQLASQALLAEREPST